MDQVPEIQRHVRKLLVSGFAGAVKELIHQQILAVVDDVLLQLRIRQRFHDVKIRRVLLAAELLPEREPGLFHQEDTDLVRVHVFDGESLAAAALAQDQDRDAHQITPVSCFRKK